MDTTLIRRQIGNILPLEIDAPGIGTLKATEHTQQRGLAAAGRT